jgi:predicted nuclease with TOPRIM domain
LIVAGQATGETDVKEQLQKRLGDLKAEFESGQKVMQDLESRQAKLRDTMLRISGAITVLEEELARYESGVNPS